MKATTTRPRGSPAAAGSGLVWPRTDPAELAKFDPRTKRCTMNCGPSSLDPRSAKERLFQCTDCSTQPRRIITHYFGPPIPTRCFDYRAQYEDADENDQFGWGPTPEAATTDLREQSQNATLSHEEGGKEQL